MAKVTGWKCFDKNLRCKDFQFEVGKTYTHNGDIKLCTSGFHFHENPKDLFKYYTNSVLTTRVCEIVGIDVLSSEDKSVCKEIKIVRELSISKISSLYASYGIGYGSSTGTGFDDGTGTGEGFSFGSGAGSGCGAGSGFGYGNDYGYGASYGFKFKF